MYEILMKYAVMGTLLTGVVCLFVLLVIGLQKLVWFATMEMAGWPFIYRSMKAMEQADFVMSNEEIGTDKKRDELANVYLSWAKQEVKT